MIQFSNYTFKGEPVLDIWKWCEENNDQMLKLYWKEWDSMTESWHYYETLCPKSWHENMRYTKGVFIKSEIVINEITNNNVVPMMTKLGRKLIKKYYSKMPSYGSIKSWICELHPDKPFQHDGCKGAGRPKRDTK